MLYVEPNTNIFLSATKLKKWFFILRPKALKINGKTFIKRELAI
jgi:hypothetical protein